MSALFSALAHPYLLGFGAAFIIAGLLMCRWASRHDIAGLATEAAIQVAWNKGNLSTETELGNRLKALQDEKSNLNRAKSVAGHAARHVLSRFVNWTGIALIVIGAGMLGAALYLK